MIALKEITESSWIIVDNESKELIGLLSEKIDKSYFMVMETEKVSFADKMELTEFFEFDIFDNVIEKVEEVSKKNYVNGYPVDLADYVPEHGHASELPAFRKSEASSVVYCAGYYCVEYPRGWLHVYCPKWTTLEKYTFEGPFHTIIECRAKLSSLKKKLKNDKRTQSASQNDEGK